MKDSNRILLGIGGAVIVIVIVIVVVARVLFGQVVSRLDVKGTVVPSSQIAVQSYPLSGFDAIAFTGVWHATIVKGDAYDVKVEVPQNTVDYLDVHTNGTTLEIRLKPGVALTGHARYAATISMPQLTALESSGANRLDFSGFGGQALRIRTDGASVVHGAGGRFDRLTIESSGAAEITTLDLTAVNADVHLSGAGQVQLRLDGGALTGDVSGAARLLYLGSVSREQVSTSGLASVKHE